MKFGFSNVWNISNSALGALLLFILGGCSSDTGVDPSTGDFERQNQLKAYADELIIPAYSQTQTRTQELQGQLNTLLEEPTQQNLQATRTAWDSAYVAYLKAAPYNFGPAASRGARKTYTQEVGTWPVKTKWVDSLIAVGDTNLSNNLQRDTRGFLALSYLLHGENLSDQAVLDSLSNPKRQAYARSIVEQILAETGRILDEWNGSYRQEFVEADGISQGSSISMLYNEFLKSYESIKNFKIGVPAGLRGSQTQPEPALVEDYYGKQSTFFARRHFEVCVAIWEGPEDLGFHDQLQDVEGGTELIENTEQSIEKIRNGFVQMPDHASLGRAIDNSPDRVKTLHDAFLQHTRFWKSDMSSLLSLPISFDSGDGD